MKTHVVVLLLLLLLCLCLSYQKVGHLNEIEHFQVQYTDPKYLEKIRTMLRDIDKLFRENDITYLIDGGTLLGAVRHQDIIPWDDDADIAIINDDGQAERKLLSLTITLRNMEYGISKFWGGYKIFFLNGEEIKKENKNWDWSDEGIDKDDKHSVPYKFPFVDIFFMERKGDKYEMSCPKVRSVWPNFYHLVQDVFPLKQYKINDFFVTGPQNPDPYLHRAYGNDWKTTAYRAYDHQNQKHLIVQKFSVKE